MIYKHLDNIEIVNKNILLFLIPILNTNFIYYYIDDSFHLTYNTYNFKIVIYFKNFNLYNYLKLCKISYLQKHYIYEIMCVLQTIL